MTTAIMVRILMRETRTGPMETRVSLPRVDMLIADHPDRYTIAVPPPAAAEPKPPRRGKWSDE